MRVLMLSWEYPPHSVGGLGKHVTELVPALTEQGVDICLLTPRWAGGPVNEVVAQLLFPDERNSHGSRLTSSQDGSLLPNAPAGDVEAEATVIRVDLPYTDFPDFFAGAWRTNLTMEQKGRAMIDQLGRFDVIHAHDWLVAFAGVALKNAYKIPLIGTIHATEYGRGQGHLASEMSKAIHNVEWWLSFEAWRVVVCSPYMVDQVADIFEAPRDKLDMIPNGVDTRPFDALDGMDLTEFRARYAWPDEHIVFMVGRMVLEKGQHLLIEAAPRILAAHPAAKFVVAGTGPMREALIARAHELGLDDKVSFPGFISDDDRNKLYKVASVAVFPSLYEPFGIVALEAMAARCPVVVSSVGGLTGVVTHHETGITVYPDSIDSLAWGVLNTLQHPDWSRARAEHAYHVVRDVFNWHAIAASTTAVYEQVKREHDASNWH
ncbi:MAG: glycosyltransferase family 4 protein [Chloroflexi bacterium]|nr:glycosyltransferase family 4 protein [Chloroflexota bacterium]MBU1748274.1 glycosyltransferase family 4 protein [Chloroflexota bacterium]MBU1878717.1 glycosyltransferase family 4 protein [Chloroflexota bacterium]